MGGSRLRNRRRLMHAAAAMGGAWLAHAPLARAASEAKGGSLAIGLLRNPVSGLIAVTEQKGWFKAAGVDISSILFAGAGGPKLIQAMGGGSVALGSVSATAALLALAANAISLRIARSPPIPRPRSRCWRHPRSSRSPICAARASRRPPGRDSSISSRVRFASSAWDSPTSSS